MTFIKNGDANPILETHEGNEEIYDEETKKALEAVKLATKNIEQASNKTELNKKSSE